MSSLAKQMKDMKQMEPRRALLLFTAFLCAVLPLEISHLLSLLAGAVGYLLFQILQPHVERVDAKPASARLPRTPSSSPTRRHLPDSPGSPGCKTPPRETRVDGRSVTRHEFRSPSAVPVQAPTFVAAGFDAEVEELLTRIIPTPQAERTVAQVAEEVRRLIEPLAPEAEVAGFATASPHSGAAFGVAVPDVEIVISVNPSVLMRRLRFRWAQNQQPGSQQLDERKLQKSAIRAFTDRLVSAGVFKFRRSGFRGQEPKVTLIAPTATGTPGQGVPIDLFVNAVTPFQGAALLSECGQLDPRARALILLVRRWAKDRGLCHAAKGHLSPYVWSLLTVYYLQVGVQGEASLLPALDSFETCGKLVQSSGRQASGGSWVPPAAAGPKQSVAELFKGFVRFYALDFDWKGEVACPRLGKRTGLDASLPLHVVVHEDGRSQVAPSIEDPFEAGHNLGGCVTSASLARLHEELHRAHKLLHLGTSLSVLLEPWAPPEAPIGEQDNE